jgi:hypothetical protein
MKSAYDEALRLSIQGTLEQFEAAAERFYGKPLEEARLDVEQLKKVWAESPINPYREEKPMKKFLVTFQRLGGHHDFRLPVTASEMAACERPIKEFVEQALERTNVTVTITDGKGQLNYGLLGEFTITPL